MRRQSRQQRDSSETAARQNNKEGNKGKEGKKDIEPSLRSDFLAWYAAYPNKKSPQDAERAYLKARTKVSAAELLAGIERYRAGKPDYAEWAHPATWLNKERWRDEYADTAAEHDDGPRGPPPKPEDLWPELKLVGSSG